MRLAHYEIQERIGKGGMGVVYKARDTHLGRTVAIKVLPPLVSNDPERRSRFLREAQAAANLNHPNIATVYQFGPAEVTANDLSTPTEDFTHSREVLFLAMEYVEGEDLQAKIGQPYSVETVTGWGIQIAEGLEAAHRAGVIHRDLKPNNVRITLDGRVKLLDFGLAKVREERLSPPEESVADIGFQTSQGMLLGTPPYMAPEMLKGAPVDHRSDLFSLGVVLFQLLTGEPPYPADNLLEYVKALSNQGPRSLKKLRPDVTPEQEAVFAQLLAHDPADRFVSAAEVARALRALGGAAPTTPVTLTRPKPAATGRPREGTAARRAWRAPLALAIAVVTLVAAIAVVYSFMKTGDAGARAPGVLTVALMPFENLTDDPSLAGLAAEQRTFLVTELHQVAGVQILLPPKAEEGQTGSSAADPRTDGILEGSLLQVGDHLRVSLSLRDSQRGLLVWAHPYDGSARRIHELRPLIASHVRIVLETWRFAGEQRRLEAADFHTFAEASKETDDRVEAASFTQIFDLALQLDPSFAKAYAGRSLTLQNLATRRRDRDLLESRARGDALRAVELDPGDPQGRLALGRVYRIQGDYQQAVHQFDQALARNPALHEVQFERSLALMLDGRLQAAADAMREALEEKPQDWDYLNQLGIVLRDLGKREEALAAFQRALEAAPEHLVAWPAANLMALALDRGDLQDVLSIAEELPQPLTDAWAASNVGTALFYRDDIGQAVEHYRRAIELEPEHAPFHRNLGDALLRLGRQELAQEAYSKAANFWEKEVSFNPNPEKRGRLLLYLAKANRCSDAREAAEGLDVTGAQASVLLFVAQQRAICGESAGALALLRQLKERGEDLSPYRHRDEFSSLGESSEFLRLTAAVDGAS